MLYVYIGKNVGTEYLNESMKDWYSDTLFQVLLEYCMLLLRPSKLSDLQNFLTFKALTMTYALSQHEQSYTIIINPWHQADNYHHNMLKPQRYTYYMLTT